MSRSTFPQRIDSFTELFDLPADKVAAALELQNLKQKTTLNNDEQNKISALSAQLQDYMITPETMNKLQDAIVEIETFFDGNVRQYILAKQQEWDTYVNDFADVGDWQPTGKYKRQNIIHYNGNLWLCTNDVVADSAHTPDKDSTHYRQMAYKGDKGDIGLNAVYKGEWSGSVSYKAGDAVSIRVDKPWNPIDMVFIAKKDNEGQMPSIDKASDYWFPYREMLVGTFDFEATMTPIHPDIHYIQLLD